MVGGIVGGLVVWEGAGTELKSPSVDPPLKPGRISGDDSILLDPPEAVAAMVAMIAMTTIPTGTQNLGLRYRGFLPCPDSSLRLSEASSS